MLTGRRFGADDAVAGGIADIAVPEDQVLSVSIERAQALSGKTRDVVKAIKETMYSEVVEALAETVSF